MRTWMWSLVVVAAACSQSPAPPAPAGTPLELRLRGVDPGDYRAVLVELRELSVTAGARALAVEPGQTHLDLARADHAWLLGTVRVPDGADRVDVRLRLDDFGGFEAVDAAGEIDARASISFSSSFDGAAAAPQATALIDLSRSLVASRADARLLLPRLSVTR